MATVTDALGSRTRGASPAARPGSRGDLQGMRAIAVLLVMFNHAGAPWLPGGYIGVDVFFVLSGFLITGVLMRDASTNGRVSIVRFYGNRAKRVLPAATVVLAATMIAATLLLNYVRAATIVKDTIWTALFASNIRFATIGTDYFANDLPPSPLQHYWSLAVEEQFYLLWPLLIAALVGVQAWRARAWHQSRQRRVEAVGPVLGGLLAAVCLVSLAWSIYDTTVSPGSAYFSTFTRAWELGLGALLAIFAARLGGVPGLLRGLASWAGLAAIITAAVLYSDQTSFPGYAALLPVLGAGAIIAGGMAGGTRFGVGVILRQQPLRWIGDASYSLYLWHWPILVIAAAQVEKVSLSFTENLPYLAATVVIAAVSYHFIENPIRNREGFIEMPSRATILWPVSITPILVAAVLVLAHLTAIPIQQAAAGERAAQAIESTAPVNTNDPIGDEVTKSLLLADQDAPVPGFLTPAVDEVSSDIHYADGHCFATIGLDRSDLCTLGDPNGAKTAVLFGDSHALMYVPAMNAWAKKRHWRMIPIGKNACGSVDVPPVPVSGHVEGACLRWQDWAFGKIAAIHPDLVVMANVARNTLADPHGKVVSGHKALSLWGDGVGRSLAKLDKSADRVVVFGDSPALKRLPTDCLATNKLTMSTCVFAGSAELTSRNNINSLTETSADASGDTYVPTASWFCSNEGVCPLIVGSTVVWADDTHITATRSRQLGPAMTQALKEGA